MRKVRLGLSTQPKGLLIRETPALILYFLNTSNAYKFEKILVYSACRYHILFDSSRLQLDGGARVFTNDVCEILCCAR